MTNASCIHMCGYDMGCWAMIRAFSKGMFDVGLDITGLYTPQLGCPPG